MNIGMIGVQKMRILMSLVIGSAYGLTVVALLAMAAGSAGPTIL